MFMALLSALLLVQAAPQARNSWPAEYKKKDAAAFAAEFEEPSRALFRYRAAMAGLIGVKPGMRVGEVGAGSGYLARYIAEKVGPEGHVFANELEPKMVEYMKQRAEKDGLKNFTAIQGTASSTGFEPASLDAIATVFALGFFDNREAMLKSINESLKPGGLLLVVDLPSEQVGSRTVGIDVEDLIALASAAGFKRERENGVVPGHYALIFRKQGTGNREQGIGNRE
jgi:ubiquinone/menaquinone biosynthesis C-methylase UbiE